MSLTSSTLADVVHRHLALVAVDGAAPAVAATLAPGFRLHLDGLTTDGDGYLALIAARWAAEGERPALDVVGTTVSGRVVTVAIEPHCLAHFRVGDGVLEDLWMTSDWRRWLVWLETGSLG